MLKTIKTGLVVATVTLFQVPWTVNAQQDAVLKAQDETNLNQTANDKVRPYFKLDGRRIWYTVYAPIDGHVTASPQVNAKYNGGLSAAQVQFDSLRKTACGKLKALKSQNKADDFACQETVYSGSVDVTSAENLAGEMVMTVLNDGLQLQLYQQQLRFAVTEDKYKEALDLQEFEVGLRQHNLKQIVNDKKYQAYMIRGEKLKHHHSSSCGDYQSCMGESAANALEVVGLKAATAKEKIQKDRLEYQFDKTLPARIKQTQTQLEIARAGLRVVEGTVKIGILSCPKDCVIMRKYVFDHQYVNKGDRLYDVAFVSP